MLNSLEEGPQRKVENLNSNEVKGKDQNQTIR
jgi:hypothetical protein